MCFAPQRRALFRHLNFQKSSEPVVFCTCLLRNVLRATTACNFSSLIRPASSAPAALASLLFDPPEPRIIGKTQCFATFLPFRAPGSSFFWLFLFLLLFSSLLWHFPSLLFICPYCREVWLLNFLRPIDNFPSYKHPFSPGIFARAIFDYQRVMLFFGSCCDLRRSVRPLPCSEQLAMAQPHSSPLRCQA